MKYLLLLSLFLLTVIAVSAQHHVSGMVEDEAGTPVSFASITSQKGLGMVTDSNGRFTIPIRKQNRLHDSILISAIGYSSQKVALRDLLENGIVRLASKEKILEQVKVYASIKGDHLRFTYYRDWSVKNEGGEIGYIFDLPKTKIVLGKVQVKIYNNYDTCWLKLHLRDAAISGLGLPENEILKKEVILATTEKNGLVQFNLNWEPVSIPNQRLYVGFELLRCGCSQSDAPTFFFVGNEAGLNYYKESEQAVWKRGGEYTIYVRLIMKESN